MEQNNTLPTWKDALRIAKGLQEEYGLPIFAMTFKGSCSCCASPDDFNKQAYLDKSVAEKSWDEIDSYVILKNAYNCGGEARFFHTQSFREGGKTRTRRVWNEFGTVYDGCNDSVDQHVMTAMFCILPPCGVTTGLRIWRSSIRTCVRRR